MFGPDCSRCGGYLPGNPSAYMGTWCYCAPETPKKAKKTEEVNPMMMPSSFSSEEEKAQWLREAIAICSEHPDQGMQLLGASLVKELEELESWM